MHNLCKMSAGSHHAYSLLQTGICGVGFSSVLSGQGSASADTTQGQILLGMGLIVLSQVCAKSQSCHTHLCHAAPLGAALFFSTALTMSFALIVGLLQSQRCKFESW